MTDITTANSEQLKQVADYSVLLRSLSGQFMRTMNQMNALQNMWNNSVSVIIGTPNNNPISDSSGLSGITPMTDTNLYAITGYFQGCLSSYYDTSHQQILTGACGPGNSV